MRAWLSIVTFGIILLVLYVSRQELAHAWGVVQQANIWILVALLVPLQFLSYYAMGETMFSYLRSQGVGKGISHLKFARLSLEMNFVNHVLPSAGVSGASYMAWRLKHVGISLSKSTSAQLVRAVAVSGGFAIVLAISVIALLLDGSLNRWMTLFVAVLLCAILALVTVIVYVLERNEKVAVLARGLVRFANLSIRLVTFGRVAKKFPSEVPLEDFLHDVQSDYRIIRRHKKLLSLPLLWGVIFSMLEVAMFYSAFLALGHPINPAIIAVAFGLAGASGLLAVTPGGAGLYEVVMVGFLTVAGVDPAVGIAAIVMARALLMLGTIVTGYYFYQQAVLKHGKSPKSVA